MSTGAEPMWHTAEVAFRRAVEQQRATAAIRTLELVGLAALSTGRTTVPESTRALLAAHPDLVRGAVAVLGSMSEMYGAEVLRSVLLARSGYQVLLDAGVWASAPLDEPSVAEGDEEIEALAARVALPPDEVPAHVPPSHTWWPRPDA